MSPIERLARAVLLFYRGGGWSGTDRNEWVMLTGGDLDEAASKVLCDLARRLLREEMQRQGFKFEPEGTP